MWFNGAAGSGPLTAPHVALEDTVVPDSPAAPDVAALDVAAPAPSATRSPTRRPRRSIWWIGIAAVLVIVAVGGVILVARPGTSAAMAAPRFVDEAATAGLDHRYAGEYPYVVGGGVGTFDCDDDGRPDLYLAGGEAPARLFRNVSDRGGALRFEPVPSETTDLTAVTGAYPLDVDGDGIKDLVILRIGENVVLRGLGECRFERANESLGLDGGSAWTTAFSATWEDESGLPTLAFGDYLGLDETGEPTTTCVDSSLIRPASDGTTYADPIPLSPGWCTLSILFSDWDRSGRRDLRVSNDRHYYRDGQEQLWRIEPGQPPRMYSSDDGWEGLQLWGMGIASQDLTGDGYPEIYLTSQGDNKLQKLAGDPSRPAYDDIALARGVTAQRPYAGDDMILPSTAWHPEFADVNNDGLLDLFVSKGNVAAQVDHASEDPSNLFIGQADGTFVEGAEAAGIMRFGLGRGAALVDLNLDGLLDLVQVVRNEPTAIWRNVGAGDAATPAAMGHWAAVDLDQPGPNRDAIGAWIETRIGDRIVQHEVTVGGGHASGELGWIHLGLGAATAADLRVTWPDGEVGPWQTIPADTFARIERGATDAVPWTP